MLLSESLPSDAAGTAVLVAACWNACCFAVHQKSYGNPFPIYIYEYMCIFIFQYISVTEMIKEKVTAYDFFIAQKGTSCRSSAHILCKLAIYTYDCHASVP